VSHSYRERLEQTLAQHRDRSYEQQNGIELRNAVEWAQREARAWVQAGDGEDAPSPLDEWVWRPLANLYLKLNLDDTNLGMCEYCGLIGDWGDLHSATPGVYCDRCATLDGWECDCERCGGRGCYSDEEYGEDED
jgi:hypothetical protein